LVQPETIVAEYERRLETSPNALATILEQKQAEIKRYMNERSRLIDLFQSGVVKKQEVEVKLKAVSAKVEQISSEKKYLERQQSEQKKLLTVIKNLDDFSESMRKNLELHSFEEKKKIVRLLVEEVQMDTVNEQLKVKHIIPLEPQKCQLRPGTHLSIACKSISSLRIRSVDGPRVSASAV
jgi:signal transduction histidine kinase